MHVQIQTSSIVKPLYHGPYPPTTSYIPLNIFDKVVNDTHVCLIYAFHPPNPPNSTLKAGLQRVLSEYREWAGRIGRSDDGEEDVILLNDEGVQFIETVVETSLDEAVLDPRHGLLSHFHPCLNGVKELIQIQLTRFSCGSLVVGFTVSHYVADGNSGSMFLVAWGKASRGVDIGVLPTHHRNIAVPRNPPKIEFEHRGLEFVPRDTIQKEDNNNSLPVPEVDVVVHKVHFTGQFLKELRAKASESTSHSCSNFKSLAAHLWRLVTKARRLQRHETTQLKSSVDGRRSMGLPNEYFGNLVLWAFPTAGVSHLLDEPLSYAAGLIQEAISTVQNKDYFLSFIDFAANRAEHEDLTCTTKVSKSALYPNMEIHSWEHFPIGKIDFGAGFPFAFMPAMIPIEGLVHLLPSVIGDGSIDAFVHLFRDNVSVFNENCYVL